MEKKIHDLRIEKGVTGYIVYTNRNVFNLNGTTKDNFPIYIFETEQALFTFISTNFNLNQ